MAAKAITDTAPDPGGRLPAMVAALRSSDSPKLARRVMRETVADLPAASSDNVTYLELTFRGRMLNRKGDQTAILAELNMATGELYWVNCGHLPPLVGEEFTVESDGGRVTLKGGRAAHP